MNSIFQCNHCKVKWKYCKKKHGKNVTKEKESNKKFKQINFIQPKKLVPAFHNAEKYLLAHMLHNPVITEKIRDELGASFNIDEHKIIATHLYAYYEEGNPADVSLFINRLEEQELQQMAIDIAMMPIDTEIGEQELRDYVQAIRVQSGSKNDIRLLKEQQRMAEQQSDPIAAAEIAVKIIELQKKVEAILNEGK
ncbi:DnaB-like helicase N-terminal domain-containing protein [Virgibacillus halophilus]|uniref:DnaB-like helicase N-terminal domain-containing protein n=1 Tax=Tigheibacillus halophilus TaxID=361280 RepID=A0ABU5CBN3_9BACI|nr:DnaB-like helicase N-terminal domain-containing protein [Virgibacillus halophilus]